MNDHAGSRRTPEFRKLDEALERAVDAWASYRRAPPERARELEPVVERAEADLRLAWSAFRRSAGGPLNP